MAQQPSKPPDPPKDFDHRVVLFPTRSGTPSRAQAHVLTALPESSSGRAGAMPQALLKGHLIRQVVVLEAAGPLGDVIEALDRAILLALADEPRGIVCDLSAVADGTAPEPVEVLATAGRHVRDWPGIPVAVACPDPQIREALRVHPLGAYLIVKESLFSAVSAVLTTPPMAVERLRLAPHPTAPRASRDFVARTLLDWRLGRVIPFASLVVSELVASSTVNAGTAIDLSVVWNLGALRLAVRDHGPALPGQQPSVVELKGRRLTVVAGLSRAFGVLPTSDGGSAVWAVLEAPRVAGETAESVASAPPKPESPGTDQALPDGGLRKPQ